MGASDAFLKAPPVEAVADAAAVIAAAAASPATHAEAAKDAKDATDATDATDAKPEKATLAADVLHSLGLMRIGDVVLALPVATLREVLPCPDVLAPLPLVAVGLRGAVQLRGSVIPVLDLRPTLGIAVVDIASPVIVVMRWSGRLLGLLADGVCGMARVRTRDLHALDVLAPAAAVPRPATHSFQLDDTVATLLDAALIAALPGVPMVLEPAGHGDDARHGVREPMLLFRTGGLPFGIAAMSVDATVPRTELRANALKNALCRGVIDHHGHEVPVIDTLAFLGLGRASQDGPAEVIESAVLVLRFPNGRVGLMLDDVRDISPVAPADILPLPRLAVDKAELFRGVLAGSEAGGSSGHTEPHLLLDAAALQADPVLLALASLSQPDAAASKATPDSINSASGSASKAAQKARTGASYVTYQVGVETASPLVQVSEILPYPQHATVLRQGREAGLGLFTHRGAAVPLVCLCSLLGRPAELDPINARVLLVRDGGETIGLVVQGLRSIEQAHWEQPERAAASGEAAGDAGLTLSGVRRFQPLVEVGMDDQRRTLPRLDLLLLARALRSEANASAPIAPQPLT